MSRVQFVHSKKSFKEDGFTKNQRFFVNPVLIEGGDNEILVNIGFFWSIFILYALFGAVDCVGDKEEERDTRPVLVLLARREHGAFDLRDTQKGPCLHTGPVARLHHIHPQSYPHLPPQRKEGAGIKNQKKLPDKYVRQLGKLIG